jgi:hypothetical protein
LTWHTGPPDDQPETADAESLPTALETTGRRGFEAVELSEAQRLVQLRRRGLMEIDDAARVMEERVTMRHLAEAAGGLLGSLERLSQDEGTWERLTAAERFVGGLQRTELLRVREALDQDLVAILPQLGYRPPPSVVEFAGRMQEALVAVLDDPRDAPGYARRVAGARAELSWFLLRLRRVLAECEEVTASRSSGLQDRVSARVRMTAWVRRAALVATPAAIAAGVVSAVAGPVGGLAAGAGTAGAEALKQVVQVGAADTMGQLLGSGGLPETGHLAKDLEEAVERAMNRLADVANEPPGAPQREAAVFMARRALYRALQEEADDGEWTPLRRAGEEALHLLRDPDIAHVVSHWRGMESVTTAVKDAVGPSN